MSRIIHLPASLPAPTVTVQARPPFVGHRTQYQTRPKRCPPPASFFSRVDSGAPTRAGDGDCNSPVAVGVQPPSITLSGRQFRVVRLANTRVVIVRGAGRMWRLAGAAVSKRVMAGLRVVAVVS